jgi:serine/threonine-protein kinase
MIPSPTDRDERLARLLDELTQQARAGRPPDLDVVARQHPDLADELRELWPAVQIADELAGPALDSRATLAPPSAPASPPRTLGDYEIVEEIGRGGMGVVYKARQKSLDRLVALKMVLRADLASGVDLARFRAEAESAARLDHAHIVSVYEVGEHDGQVFFSMKYVEGTTLAKLLAAGPLSSREAASLLLPICQAVHHAHQQGILHRDLKPSNILLQEETTKHTKHTKEDQSTQEEDEAADSSSFRVFRVFRGSLIPYVTDFGLAKRIEGGLSLTGTGAIVGTPSYMAPEQAAGSRGKVEVASDVYSLGAILYEMLTGRPPFQAASQLDTLLLVLEQDVQPPHLLNRRVDRDLEMICLKCLQKPPELRYRSAKELADDLQAFLNGEPVAARSGHFSYVVGRLFRETHQASVLENWGLLWMWHSLALIILCSLTNVLALRHVASVWPYLAIWVVGLGTWASIFWALRRRAGPVTFVERQIAHVWAASTMGSIAMFGIEVLLRLPVLTLSPVLAVLAAMVFVVKAGMLSGTFYLAAAAMLVTSVIMAVFPDYGLFLFGLASAACFFIPGWKYHRQRLRSGRLAR